MKEYKDFWQQNGLDFITPRGVPHPEGFDIRKALENMICGQSFLEIGCGTGRIAALYHPFKYVGVDINPAAIEVARKACPEHEFHLVGLDDELPVRTTVLLYTVLLHIPDEIIDAQLQRFCAASAGSVIIGEIMEPKQRRKRNPNAAYDISNQRSATDYMMLMSKQGFRLAKSVDMPYEHYKGKSLTLMHFVRE